MVTQWKEGKKGEKERKCLRKRERERDEAVRTVTGAPRQQPRISVDRDFPSSCETDINEVFSILGPLIKTSTERKERKTLFVITRHSNIRGKRPF